MGPRCEGHAVYGVHVRYSHVDGGGLLHLHLRQSGPQVLPEGDQLHSSCYPHWQILVRDSGSGGNFCFNFIFLLKLERIPERDSMSVMFVFLLLGRLCLISWHYRITV